MIVVQVSGKEMIKDPYGQNIGTPTSGLTGMISTMISAKSHMDAHCPKGPTSHKHKPTQNLYYNYYYLKHKYLIIGESDP